MLSGGGTEIVSSGGIASGATVASGGTVEIFDGGMLAGNVVNNGMVDFDISGSASFGGTLTGSGTLVVSGGGVLDVLSAYTGAAQIDDTSTLEFASTYSGAATFSGAAVGPGGTLKLDAGSTGPITVVNPNDTVIAKPGNHNWIDSTVDYTLPANIDTLVLFGSQGTGNSDASGDALYAANPGITQTLIGNSANDVFVVYNSSDVVVPKAGSHDVVYAAVNYTLPTGVDVLILEAGTQGIGNSDAAGDVLCAANPGMAATLTGNSAHDVFAVYDSSDVVVPKAGSHDVVYTAVDYTLPTGIDTLILEGSATTGAGNNDAAGDALYAANPALAATLIGNSHNDAFAVYNSGDKVIGQAGSTDAVYAAADFTLPTNVDTLVLEGSASQGTGNSDAIDVLYGNAGVASTLIAGSGADILVVAGAAGTVLTGGAGHDTFAFPNAMGHDEVTNFGVAKDTLQFNASLFANLAAAMADATQVGASTVFTIDANDQVTLDNVQKGSLAASNFHFI
jgi:autotransporter passenger strand-loop-strand repeat protein